MRICFVVDYYPPHIGGGEMYASRFSEGGFADIRILPSTLMDCAGHFGLSVIPKATTAQAYGRSSPAAHIPRFLAGFITVLYFPMALIENYLLRRPACGLILARKA